MAAGGCDGKQAAGGNGHYQIVALDIHNLPNGNSVSRERHTLANYLQPLGLQAGRMAKLSFQHNF